MGEEVEVLKLVARRLDEAGIPYMVTGSMAVAFYAIPRMTRDVDLVIELSMDDTDRLCALLNARDTHSAVQLGDVRDLLRSVADLDHAYLDEWTARLNLTPLYREATA